MRYFDLHCDTLTECFRRGQSLNKNSLHVSMESALAFEKWAQVFAVFISDDLRGEEAWNRFLGVAATARRLTGESAMPLCGDGEELSAALQNGGRAAVLSIEGSAALGGDLERLEEAYKLGVRLITLTWNGACEAGGGCLDGGGLSPFGFELLRRMGELGVVADVSHLSDRGFEDVAGAVSGTFVATHSDSRSVCDNPRNLTDGQFCEIVRRGGLVGLNLYPDFLGGSDLRGVLRHADRFLSLGGEGALSVGADFDGASMPKGVRGVADMPRLYSMMRESYGETLADRIFFGNAYNFFKTVLTPHNSCNNINKE